MKIEQTQITKLYLSDLMESHRLDPITVILEDVAPKQGKIIVECYSQSWATFFSGMGDNLSIAQFCCSVPSDYLANRFYSGDQSEHDFEGLKEKAIKHIFSERRKLFIGKDEARELYEEVTGYHWPENIDQAQFKANLMVKLFGDDWWYAIPEKPTPQWEYTLRVASAVQEGLRQFLYEKEGE